METPKLFISYSWSNSTHEEWVINLAKELTESGVHVILDKWDLKEGHDSVAFMEKMVTDPQITKVAMICDEVYASKADGRSGGVGTETQIISREVYENQEQGKFVAIIPERDSQGKAYLPTYYKSRIYIDLSEPDNYADNFEKLLRWIYDKPLYTRPDIGKRPSFLDESNGISLGTTAAHKRAISAIKEKKAFMSGALDEYFSTVVSNLEKFRITEKEGEFDDQVIDSIEKFLPYRNELINLFVTLAQYAPEEENIQKVHRFFESLIPYMSKPENVNQWSEWDFDNFKFIVHELFLYAIAIFIKYERFSEIDLLLKQQYYVAGRSDYGKDVMVGYDVFREYLRSLDYRNGRLKLRRLSVHADLLEQRSKHSGIEFRHLMQADFVLFMRAEIMQSDVYCRWFPDTLLYVGRFHGAFEVFARSSSKSYFEKVKCILGIDKPSDLDELMEAYKTDRQRLPRWDFESFSPSLLLGYEQLATKA
ncbi:SEFIR domain-containing protein [Vibrio parahaemolyticus]|uniref:SEFIR domain-containing protein n=1 Tax=Vibrio parahaemolyticus TaxID=670 RepID=UPI001EEAF56F|nr:TIR domain-containing protein [Vibrio parahaemolyticus]MCG6451653.1 TIR domain-containing protein [Vibrio parahaemolyticus]HCZ9714721.1 TIR domain-containing protein [Vibrio parahaemolyticus]